MTVCRVSCIFQSCAPSPNNAKSREAQAPAEPEMWIMVKRKLTVGGLICHLASVSHFHCLIFFDEYVVPHAISLWNMIPGSLLPHFNCGQSGTPREENRPAHLHFPNKTNCRWAQYPNNSCTSAVGTKSFPAPVSNVVCSIVQELR